MTNQFQSRAAVLAVALSGSLADGLLSSAAQAQSESSLIVSAEGFSELSGASAAVLGSAIGAGAGLTLGAILITGTGASASIDTATTAGSEAAVVTLSIAGEIAEKLQAHIGEPVVAIKTMAGTRLRCADLDIAFLPDADKTASSPRRPL